MKSYFGLTSTEVEIMEMFWTKEGPFSFREIMEYMSTERKKVWKKQTLNTYLFKLQKMDLIHAEETEHYQRYSVLCTKDEFIQRWTRKLVEESYGNSIANFVAAFTGGKKLSPEDAEKIKELI